MELYEAIFERHMVRSFADETVPDEVVQKLLRAAVAAPSAGNLQSWRFYIVSDADLKAALADAAGQRFIGRASHTIVVCADLATAEMGYENRGVSLYCLQDTAAAIENILLAVTAEGLGACWVGAFNEAETSKVLDLPNRYRPVALIPLGYPRLEAPRRPRKALGDVVEWR